MSLYELSDQDVAYIELAITRMRREDWSADAKAALLRLADLKAVRPTVGIYVEGGLIQGIRASSDITAVVADMDVVEELCMKGRDADLQVIACNCPPETPQEDRDEHKAVIERYNAYRALPCEVD
jgi:hypothetical protein